MVMGFSCGLTGKDIRAIGKMDFKKDRVFTSQIIKNLLKENGLEAGY